MKVTGKITKITDVQKGTTKKGDEWQKIGFLLETEEQYNNQYFFDVFGVEKVENFKKYNKENDVVEVEFNVRTNEWQGKYYTSLDAWKIYKVKKQENIDTPPFETIDHSDVSNSDDNDDLPF